MGPLSRSSCRPAGGRSTRPAAGPPEPCAGARKRAMRHVLADLKRDRAVAVATVASLRAELALALGGLAGYDAAIAKIETAI